MGREDGHNTKKIISSPASLQTQLGNQCKVSINLLNHMNIDFLSNIKIWIERNFLTCDLLFVMHIYIFVLTGKSAQDICKRSKDIIQVFYFPFLFLTLIFVEIRLLMLKPFRFWWLLLACLGDRNNFQNPIFLVEFCSLFPLYNNCMFRDIFQALWKPCSALPITGYGIIIKYVTALIALFFSCFFIFLESCLLMSALIILMKMPVFIWLCY